MGEENALGIKRPDLITHFHPTKNGDRTPFNITFGSGKKVWWVCENGHEWHCTVRNRVRAKGCMYCRGTARKKAVRYYHRDVLLKDAFPNIYQQALNGRNSDIDVSGLLAKSGKKIWWECQRCQYLWNEQVRHRVHKAHNCPRCEIARRSIGAKFPHVVNVWDNLNNGVSPFELSTTHQREHYFYHCSTCDHQWSGPLRTVIQHVKTPCPICRTYRRSLGFLRPEILLVWDSEKNVYIDPFLVTKSVRNDHAWIRCEHCSHSYEASLRALFYHIKKCPSCNNNPIQKRPSPAESLQQSLKEMQEMRQGVRPKLSIREFLSSLEHEE